MDLDLLCRLFVGLAGVMTTIACGSRVKGSELRVVPHLPQIGRILSNWPAEFHSFCDTWAKLQVPKTRYTDNFQWAFYWLFYLLYKNARERKHQLRFVVKEALAYGRLEWREMPVFIRDASLERLLPPQRFISTNEAAGILGIPAYGAMRWFRKGRLSWTVVGKTRKGRLVVDIEKLRQVKLSRHPLREARSVSRELGVPHKLLKVLRQDEHLPAEYLTTVEGSLSSEDVERFERDVCKHARICRNNAGRIAVTEYLYSTLPTLEDKVALVASIRDGRTTVFCSGHRSIRCLYLESDLLSQAKKKRREGRVRSLLQHTQEVFGLDYREARATLFSLGLDRKARLCTSSKKKLSKFFEKHATASEFARQQGVPIRFLHSHMPHGYLITLRYDDCGGNLPCVVNFIRPGARKRAEAWCARFRLQILVGSE
ncbi:hypothetical protein [Arenimonas sp. MALMAid1274]|uniref:hypothetical protein n=1 Tax=Arenimonas sp. MALMAid1274 TaxID=3411630 RepID=UPI003BA381EA